MPPDHTSVSVNDEGAADAHAVFESSHCRSELFAVFEADRREAAHRRQTAQASPSKRRIAPASGYLERNELACSDLQVVSPPSAPPIVSRPVCSHAEVAGGSRRRFAGIRRSCFRTTSGHSAKFVWRAPTNYTSLAVAAPADVDRVSSSGKSTSSATYSTTHEGMPASSLVRRKNRISSKRPVVVVQTSFPRPLAREDIGISTE